MKSNFSKCIAACDDDDDSNDSDTHDDFDKDTKDDGDDDNFDGTGGTDMMMKMQNWELHLLCDPHIHNCQLKTALLLTIMRTRKINEKETRNCHNFTQ